MIVTLTPNPSLDRTATVPALVRGGVLRAVPRSVEPSGKGLNVALALARQGHDAVAVLPVGGPTGALLVELLAGEAAGGRLHLRVVPVAGDVRTNTSLVEPDGTVTKVNEPGPALVASEVAALLTATTDAVDGDTSGDPGATGTGTTGSTTGAGSAGAPWLATCGSLPPGAPGDLHAQVVRLGHDRGLPVVVDASGAALAASLPARPDLVKPNAEELAGVTGMGLRTLGDCVDAARALRGAGAGAVLVSLGADGAVLLEGAAGGGDRALHATARASRVLSTVGAGDALLAGYLSATGDSRDRLRAAVRWGAAAVGSAGTLFTLADAPAEVRIGPVERDLVLTEPASS